MVEHSNEDAVGRAWNVEEAGNQACKPSRSFVYSDVTKRDLVERIKICIEETTSTSRADMTGQHTIGRNGSMSLLLCEDSDKRPCTGMKSSPELVNAQRQRYGSAQRWCRRPQT